MAREKQETVWVSPPLAEKRGRWLQYNLFSLTNRLTTFRLEIAPYGQVGASPVQRDQLRGGLTFPLPLWPEFCEAINHGKVVLIDRGLSSDYPDEPVGNGIPLCDREELLKTRRILDNWVQVSLLHKTNSFGYQRRIFVEVLSGGMGAVRMPAEYDVASMAPFGVVTFGFPVLCRSLAHSWGHSQKPRGLGGWGLRDEPLVDFLLGPGRVYRLMTWDDTLLIRRAAEKTSQAPLSWPRT